MNTPLLFLIWTVLFFGSIYIIVSPAWRMKKRMAEQRKNPIHWEMLRSPGESLREELEIIDEKLNEYLTWSLLFPLILVAALLVPYLSGKEPGIILYAALLAMLIAGTIYLRRKINPLVIERHRLRLGYEGEKAVGAELNQLMLDGFHVFHDFPAEKFNIDHIVIGPNGVFAVETKFRSKPKHLKGKDASIHVGGNTLRFAGWNDTETIPQAKRQAAWLSRWLSDAYQQQIPVTPIIAVPGWWVENYRTSHVYSGRNIHSAIANIKGSSLSSDAKNFVVKLVDQRCRNIQSKQFRKPTLRDSEKN